jgi:hypothetical protein
MISVDMYHGLCYVKLIARFGLSGELSCHGLFVL